MIPDPLYEKEYNCKLSELVNGFPPADKGEEGARAYVWDDDLKVLSKIFKKVFGEWYEL